MVFQLVSRRYKRKCGSVIITANESFTNGSPPLTFDLDGCTIRPRHDLCLL